MILEGIVTTVNENGSTNVSPMGPRVLSDQFTEFVLRPYQSSTTYANLRRHRQGVLHVTDNVEMMARAAIGEYEQFELLQSGDNIRILVDACRWYVFDVKGMDDSEERATIDCQIVNQGRMRDFIGFCRAKHAVIEAAILATRTRFLPADEILDSLERLAMIVQKTAGEAELRAFALLRDHVDSVLSDAEADHAT